MRIDRSIRERIEPDADRSPVDFALAIISYRYDDLQAKPTLLAESYTTDVGPGLVVKVDRSLGTASVSGTVMWRAAQSMPITPINAAIPRRRP